MILVHKPLSLQSCIIAGRLWTIWTIFTTSTCLNGKKSTLLHFPKLVHVPMDLSLKEAAHSRSQKLVKKTHDICFNDSKSKVKIRTNFLFQWKPKVEYRYFSCEARLYINLAGRTITVPYASFRQAVSKYRLQMFIMLLKLYRCLVNFCFSNRRNILSWVGICRKDALIIGIMFDLLQSSVGAMNIHPLAKSELDTRKPLWCAQQVSANAEGSMFTDHVRRICCVARNGGIALSYPESR